MRSDNKQPFRADGALALQPTSLDTRINSNLQIPNINFTSPDTYFNMTIGSNYVNPLPGFKQIEIKTGNPINHKSRCCHTI